MFLPVGDTPNPKGFTPFVNYLLIAANVAVYALITLPLSSQQVDPTDPLLVAYLRQFGVETTNPYALLDILQQMSAYDLFVYRWGFKPAAPELADLFAAMFLHGGFLHLAGNMLFLWIFGDNVEHRLGRVGYLLVYLATGVVATLSFGVFAHDSMVPLVGASGAISGVLGLYFVLFKKNRVKTFVFFFPFIFNVILIPARWVLGFYLIVDNLLPVLVGADSGVAYGAHIGGFVGGYLAARVGEHYGWRWPWTERGWRKGPQVRVVRGTAEDVPAGEGDSAATLRAAIHAGNRARAIEVLGQLPLAVVARLSGSECVLLAQWLERAGYPVSATRVLRTCLGGRSGGADVAPVLLALGELRLRQGQPTAAYQHLLSVFDHDPEPDVAARAKALLANFGPAR